MRAFPQKVLVFAGAGVVFWLVACMAGCGRPGGGSPADSLAPGTMKVIAVEPVDRGGTEPSTPKNEKGTNLLLCNDFSNWWSGAPAPNGLLPPDGSRSLISRSPEGNIRQEWTRPEDAGSLKQRMRSQPVTLQPGTYQLEITACSVQKGAALVGLWREDGGSFVALPVEPIILLPGPAATKRYVRTFTLDESAKISVASEIPSGTPPQTAVHWLSWILKRAG
ncbi:MAG TPA: hypothetical protein PK379_12910 [Candidatus Hydrogenedentes bacterium]|nr:hypothetical protein [Candidatus Hydrogenedentota bacterium]